MFRSFRFGTATETGALRPDPDPRLLHYVGRPCVALRHVYANWPWHILARKTALRRMCQTGRDAARRSNLPLQAEAANNGASSSEVEVAAVQRGVRDHSGLTQRRKLTENGTETVS